MRIAYNCRSCSNRGGIGRYSRGLIKTLIEKYDEHSFLLFCPPRIELTFLKEKPNWERFNIQGSTNRPLWETYVLTNAVNSAKPDIFHNPDYTIPSGIVAPSTVTVHDMSFKYFPTGISVKAKVLYNLMTPQSVRKAKLVMVDSDSTKRELLRAGWKPEKFIRVVHLAVDDDMLDEINEEESKKVLAKFRLEPGYILYLGALDKRKNIPYLVMAYSELKKADSSTPPLVIAGEDIGGAAEITDLILKLDLGNDVKFIDYVEPSMLKAIYSNAVMFVFPSAYEGFGLPPLESMACGVPVIVSDSTSLPEVVGDCGLITPLGDIPALLESMKKLLTDHNLHSKLSVAGRKRASQFTWDRVAENVMAVYEEILEIK